MESDIGEQGIAREMLQEADDGLVKTSVCQECERENDYWMEKNRWFEKKIY
jgi:hypothetical protein